MVQENAGVRGYTVLSSDHGACTRNVQVDIYRTLPALFCLYLYPRRFFSSGSTYQAHISRPGEKRETKLANFLSLNIESPINRTIDLPLIPRCYVVSALQTTSISLCLPRGSFLNTSVHPLHTSIQPPGWKKLLEEIRSHKGPQSLLSV